MAPKCFLFPLLPQGLDLGALACHLSTLLLLENWPFKAIYLKEKSVCVCVHTRACTHMELRGQLLEKSSLLLPCRIQWLNEVTQPAPVCAGLLPAEPPWERASECTPHRNSKLIVLSNYFGTINLSTNCIEDSSKKRKGGVTVTKQQTYPVSTPGLGSFQLNGNDCWLGLLSSTKEYLLLWVIIQEAEISFHHTSRSCNGD